MYDFQATSMSAAQQPIEASSVWVVEGITDYSLSQVMLFPSRLASLKIFSFDSFKRLFAEHIYLHMALPQHLLLKLVCLLMSEGACSKTNFLRVVLHCVRA